MAGLTNYGSIENATLATLLVELNTRNIAPHQIVAVYYAGSVHVAVYKL